MVATSSLLVDRFRADYVAHAPPASPMEVRARLDQVARARLPAALERALAPWLEGAGQGVLLIRQLRVNLTVAAAWDADRIARVWAEQIACAVGLAMRDGGVVRFADRAAFLARFLADVATGVAWGKWYYAGFHGLRPLSSSAALRTAICDDAELGLRALLVLSDGERRRVVEALSPRDARRLLGALPAGAMAEDGGGWDALRAAWDALPPHAPPAADEPRVALELYLRACAMSSAHAGPRLRARALALVRVARLLAAASPARAARLMEALRHDAPARLYLAAHDDAETLRPLIGAPAGWVEAASRMVAPARVAKRATAEKSATVEPLTVRSTPFGGFFLLLPFLDQLPLAEAVASWPAAGDTPPAAALRLLLLSKALGSARSARVFWDPLARDLAGVAPSLTPPAIRSWLARVPRRAFARCVRTLAEAACAERRAAGDLLALVGAHLPRAPAALLLHAPSGDWLWASGYSRRRPSLVTGRAMAWMQEQGLVPARVVADAELGPVLRAPASGVEVLGFDDDEVARLAVEDVRVGAVLARRSTLGSELAYLGAREPRLPRAADLALSVAAQRMLRAFAARLPGFHASGLPYLFANFLDVAARVEVEPARWVVQLSRPPLQFVLALSGVARGEHRPSWRPQLAVALCQDEG
jgi:hypothetical protein